MVKKKKLNMTTIIMISMVVGVIFGLASGRSFPLIETIGQVFLRLIQMSIILLVTGQIIEAVGGIKASEAGKIGVKTVVIFFVSTLLAAIFGVFMALVLKPGVGLDLTAVDPAVKVTAGQATSLTDTILGFFPSNIVAAMSNGVIVQVIIFAIMFGLALSYVNRSGETKLFGLIKEFNKGIMRIIAMIMQVAPVGVFALVASSIGKYGVKVIIPLAKYLGTFGLGTLIFLIIWILVVALSVKVSFGSIVKGISRMSTMALATTSSAITLPIEMEDAEAKLGVPSDISKIVLPLGVSLNSNGAAMHMAITIITIAQLYGVTYSFPQLMYIVVLASFASLANAVVPGAGLVSLSIVVPQMGLPLESIALFAGVEWFVGMLRTITNVDSDTFTAMLVAKSEGRFKHEQFRKGYVATDTHS